jgi:hypothetical protein
MEVIFLFMKFILNFLSNVHKLNKKFVPSKILLETIMMEELNLTKLILYNKT